MNKRPPSKPVLIFQLWSGDNGIFFEKKTHEELRQIQKALEDSKTWGEFRSSLPPGEFEQLRLWWTNDGEYIFQNPETSLGMKRPELDDFHETYAEDSDRFTINEQDQFEMGEVPGVQDGDYPPWLSCTAIEVLPKDFVKKYGQPASSMVSGFWYEFPSDQLTEMQRDLEVRGFTVEVHMSYD